MIKAETPVILDTRVMSEEPSALEVEVSVGSLLVAISNSSDDDEPTRILLGLDEDYGNPNYDRPVFPFTNNEVLTEISPRMRSIYAETVRDQDRMSFFDPTQIDSSVGPVDLSFDIPANSTIEVFVGGIPTGNFLFNGRSYTAPTAPRPAGVLTVFGPPAATTVRVLCKDYANQSSVLLDETRPYNLVQKFSPLRSTRYDGAYAFPLEIKNKSVAATIDYQAYIGGKPVRSGTIKLLASPSSITITDDGFGDNTINMEFSIERMKNKFALLVKCEEEPTLIIKTTIVGRTNAADNLPPVWVTAPNLGVVTSQVTLLALDPEGYPVTYHGVNLPDGFVVDKDTGVLSIAPEVVSGEYKIVVGASDGGGLASREFTVFINAAPVWITPAGALGTWATGAPVSFQLQAEDPNNDPLVFSAVGSLPNGLSLSPTGLITGVAVSRGTFTVKVSDPYMGVDRTFSFFSNAAPIWNTPSGSIGQYAVGSSINFQFSATDPDGDVITFTVAPSSSLPSGVSLSATGLLTGTVNSSGAFILRASDEHGSFEDRSFSLSANQAPVWVTQPDGVGPLIFNSSVNFQFVATDTDPITFSRISGTLPRNMALSSTGLMSGTVYPVTPEYLEFPISANTLVEVFVNGVQTDDFLVNGEPYNPPISTGSAWAKVEPLDVTAPPVLLDSSYLVTYGSETYFRSKPEESLFITDGSTFVPEIGKTYTITYKARKVIAETNGIDSCFRPAFDANRASDGVQDNAMGTKYGFELTPNDLISTTNWVLNQFYTVSATWTPTIAYSSARGRLRVNRISGEDSVINPPPYSNAVFEVQAAEISEGTQRPKSTVFVPAPSVDATVKVVTRAISNPSTIVDDLTITNRPVTSPTYTYTLRASDGMLHSDRTFTTMIYSPDLPPTEGYIVDTNAEYNAAISAGNAPPTQQEIFDSWDRFDRSSFYPSGTAPGGEATGWVFSGGVIQSTINSAGYTGFVSPQNYDFYTHSATVSSTSGDDDAIGLVIAFAMVNGVPNALLATRSCGGVTPMWGIVHMAGPSVGNVLVNGDTLADTSAFRNASGGGGWAVAGQTKIEVTRNLNEVTVRCSQIGGTTIDPLTTLTYTIPEDSPFAGAKPYGYTAYSQPQSSFVNSEFSGGLDKTVIYDARSMPVKVMVYNFSTSTWERDWSRSIFRDFNYPRNVSNPVTGKTFRLTGPRPYNVEYIGGGTPPVSPIFNYDHTKLLKAKAAISKTKSNLDDATILFIGDSTTYGGGAGNDTNPIVGSYNHSYPVKAANRITGVPVSIDSRAGDGNSGAGYATDIGWFMPIAAYDSGIISESRTIVPSTFNTVGGYSFQGVAGGEEPSIVLFPRKTWDIVDFMYVQSNTMNLGIGNVHSNLDQSIDCNANTTPVSAISRTIAIPQSGPVAVIRNILTGNQTFHTLGWRFRSSTQKRLFFVNAGARAWNSTNSASIGWTNESNPWSPLNAMNTLWKPDLTIINLGINDYRSGGSGITVAQYKTNIQKIINKAKLSGDVILCVPNNINPNNNGPIPDTQFHQALYELATTNDIPLINFAAVLGSYEESVANGTQRDDLHPNQAGYDGMGEIVATLLEDLISNS